jgi:hypothetical protein
MALYTLCIQPRLKILVHRRTGIQIEKSTRPMKVVAYADDVTIFISSVTELTEVEKAL